MVWDVQEAKVVHSVPTAPPAVSGTSYHQGHESDVEVLVWAYGGTCLLSGSKDSNIKVWDVQNGFKELETIFGHKATVLALTINETRHTLASAGRDSTIKLWDISSLQPGMRARRSDDSGVRVNLLGNMDGHRGDVTSLAWSLTSPVMLYSGARDNTIKAWNVELQTEIRDVEDTGAGTAGKHRGDVRSLLVFPRPGGVQAAPPGTTIPSNAPPGVEGGDVLVTASLDSSLKVWSLVGETDAPTALSVPAVTAQPEEGTEGDGSAAAAQDAASTQEVSPALGGGGDDWDANTGAILDQILHGGSTAEALLGSTDAPDRVCFTLPAFSEDGVYAMAVSPAGPIAAISSSQNAVVLMRIEGIFGGHIAPLQAFQGHNNLVGDVELLEDESSIVTASSDNFVARFNIDTTEVASRFGFGSAVHCLSLGSTSTGPATAEGSGALPAPFVFAGGADYVVRAFSSNQADYGPMEQAYAADWAKRQQPGSPRIPPHNYVCAKYEGHVGRVEAVAVTEDGNTMVSGARDFYILVWNLAKRQPKVPTAICSESDIPSYAPSARIEAHYGHVTDLRWSFTASPALLASGGNDHAVKVWKVSSGMLGKSISSVWEASTVGGSGHDGAVSAVTWGKHASGQLLFSAGWDKLIKVWEGTTGKLLANLRGHTSRITDLDTSSDGTKVVSCAADFTARVWSTSDPFTCLALYKSQTADGGMASISAGNAKFVTASDNGVLRVWPISSEGEHASLFSAGQAVSTTPGPVTTGLVAPGGQAPTPVAVGGSPADGAMGGPAAGMTPAFPGSEAGFPGAKALSKAGEAADGHGDTAQETAAGSWQQ